MIRIVAVGKGRAEGEGVWVVRCFGLRSEPLLRIRGHKNTGSGLRFCDFLTIDVEFRGYGEKAASRDRGL